MGLFFVGLSSQNTTMRMGLGTRAALMLFLFFFGGSRPAHAWGNTWMGIDLERIVNSARRQAGPFKFDSALRVSNAGYDSNLYYGSGYDPVPDYTIFTGLPTRLFLPWKRKVVFDISEHPQYAYYARTDKERGWNNFFRGGVHLVFRNVYFYLGGGLTNARERISSETDVNVRLTRDQYGGAVHWQLARRASSSVELNQVGFDYEDVYLGTSSVSETLNRTESYARLTGYYQPLSGARLFLSGRYGAYDFTAASNPRDSQSYEISSGVEIIGQENLQGIIDLGYKYFASIEHPRQDYQGVVGNTSLFFRPWRRTQLQATARRDIVFSAYSDLAYFIETLAGGGLSQSLSRRVALSYTIYLGRNDYPLLAEEAGDAGVKRKDDYVIHSLGLNMRLSRDLLLSLVVNLRSRDSTEAWADDQKYFLGFNLTYGL